jgi:T5orf172 domain
MIKVAKHSSGVVLFLSGRESDLPEHAVGFTYVLSNPAMPGIVKVGWSSLLPEDRAMGLYKTGVPLPFMVEFGAMTSFPREVEAAAHTMLAGHRVSSEREFFQVPPYLAIEAVQDARLSAASIDAWRSARPHRVRDGDQIAITTAMGDLFVVLAHQDREAEHAVVSIHGVARAGVS